MVHWFWVYLGDIVAKAWPLGNVLIAKVVEQHPKLNATYADAQDSGIILALDDFIYRLSYLVLSDSFDYHDGLRLLFTSVNVGFIVEKVHMIH